MRTLSFDAWIYHTQLEDVFELASAFPRIPLILDHVGGLLGVARYEGRQDAALREWRPRAGALPVRERLPGRSQFRQLWGGLELAASRIELERQPALLTEHL
jgi:hypothetical protein